MGGSAGEWTQRNGFRPNGLLVEEVGSATRPLDPVRWVKAEASTAELISRIQPNRPSERHRNAVALYVQRLVSQCVPCQVFTFGSVPLKTYLPDGDIDLTAFSKDQSLKDNWAKEVRDMLEREEKNENAEFPVKEVQYIQAEVKIIKCLVDNIVVDISFNQLGGLCTLCFLEEVDNLINQNHLFKRSIILIKAWCYYESRILGAHHGLISTYALETLVLYIFHVFNNSFVGPLEVLYRFLEFFSKFDWANFCVSLWGPVPISSLPNMQADSPRKDGGELLLNKMFLNACGIAYSVFPASQENQEQPFITKHFNVIDPLRYNNNLGRSVSKGNFYRIRSAFSLGAQQLAKILECQDGDIEIQLKQFFLNTYGRHGKGCRPDAPHLDAFQLRRLGLECVGEVGKHTTSAKAADNFISNHNAEVESDHSRHSSVKPSFPVHQAGRTSDAHSDLHASKPKDYDDSRSQMSSGRDHYHSERSKLWKKQCDDIKRTCRMNILQSRVHAAHHFARTSSSPELTSMSSEAAPVSRVKVATENSDNDASSRSEHSRRMRSREINENHVANCFTDEPSIRESSSVHSLGSDLEHSFSGCVSNSVSRPEISVDEPNQSHVQEQDSMHKTSGIQNYGRSAQMPVNLAAHSFAPFPPSIMGYSHQNYAGMVPTNFSAVASDRGLAMPYCNGPFSAPLHPQFHPVKVTPEQGVVGGLSKRAESPEVHHQSENLAYWTHGNTHLVREIDPEIEDFSTASSSVSPPSPATSSRTMASSESSWDVKASKMANPERYPSRKNTRSTMNSSAKVNTGLDEVGEPADHACEDINDNRKVWTRLSTTESVSPSVTSSHLELPGFGQAQMSGQNSMSPFGPVLVHPGSQQGVPHNHAVLPVACYPSGPVPIVTMVPLYNLPAETGKSGAPTAHSNVEEDKPTHYADHSGHNSASAIKRGQQSLTDRFDSRNMHTSREHSEDYGSDIFNSDFASHWKNLQYGRLCQSSHLQHPMLYPPPVLIPPQQLQGHIPFEAPQSHSPGRSNTFAHVVPVSAPQPGSGNPIGVSERYDAEVTKQRIGTGTYFPNPKIIKERQYSSSRQYRGHQGRDRNENHGDRESNRNFNSKPRYNGRTQHRNHYENPNTKMDQPGTSASETDEPWNMFHQNSNHLYRFSKCTPPPKPDQYCAVDVGYSVYRMHPGHVNGVSSSGEALPPYVMLYPYPPPVGYTSWTEKLQFGSVRPEHFVGAEAHDVSGYANGGEHELQNYQGDTGPPSPTCSSGPKFPI